jgi:hypothetical protein
MKIYQISEILKKLDNCIINNLPFSHIRFGDGGIKFIHAVLFNDVEQLKIITKKEGIPYSKIDEIFEMWGYVSRRADFIDCPEVYFDGQFWPRMKGESKYMNQKTSDKMVMWKTLYRSAEFDNENYCNPESNYLMLLRDVFKKNLFDIMKNRKLCIITARPEVKEVLIEKGYDVDVIKIVGHYQDQYTNSFGEVIIKIYEMAKNYDLFMISAGELGRIYSGYIKEHGGRCVDIGFVTEFFLGEELHPRLKMFMKRSEDNPLELELTEKGKLFQKFI